MQLIILPGWKQNKKNWERNISQLRRIGKTYAWDLPGFGDEPLVSDQWGIPEYADWVEKKIAKNGYKSVVLLGHSFGGRVSALIASRRRNWLKAIILVGTPALYRPNTKIRFVRLLTNIFSPRIKYLLPSFLKPRSEEYEDAKKTGVGEIFAKAVTFDQTESLKNINIPTLLIWGENDYDVPLRIAREMSQIIKSSQLVIVPSSGHQLQFDSPNLLYANVKKFIENL